MINQDIAPLPALARVLGFAGLLPQALLIGLLLFGGAGARLTAQVAAFAYAALIFSFLGGVWWGLAAAGRARVPQWVWLAAVIPSLLALAIAWPLAVNGPWPQPSLIGLGLALATSLLVDLRLKALGLTPEGWLALRVPLSLGLGLMTLTAGLI